MNQEIQRQVWQRVYAQPPARLTPRQRQQLRQCLQRCRANLQYFESQSRDPLYGPAYDRLAAETQSHMQMIRQILGD